MSSVEKASCRFPRSDPLERREIDSGIGEADIETSRTQSRSPIRQEGTEALGGLDRDSPLQVEGEACNRGVEREYPKGRDDLIVELLEASERSFLKVAGAREVIGRGLF